MLRIYLLVVVQFTIFALSQNSRNEEDLVNELSARIDKILDPNNTLATLDIPRELELSEPDDTITVPMADTIFNDQIGDSYHLSLHNTTIIGFADLVDSINTTKNNLEIRLTATIKHLLINGDFILVKTAYTPFERIAATNIRGAFIISKANVIVEGTASLINLPNGQLTINNVVSTISYSDWKVSMNSTTLPISVTLTAETMVLILKPYILENINKRLTNVALLEAVVQSALIPIVENKNWSKDRALLKGQKYVNHNYEPYQIPFFSLTDSIKNTTTRIGPIQLHGLSNFHFTDNVTVTVLRTTVQIGIKIATSLLSGQFPLTITDGNGHLESNDTARFTLQYLAFVVKIDFPIGYSYAHPILSELNARGPDIIEGLRVHLDSEGTDVLDIKYILLSGIKNWLAKKIEENIQNEILSKLYNGEFQQRIVELRYKRPAR